MSTTELEAVSTCVSFYQPTCFTCVLECVISDYMPALLEGVIA